MAGKTFLLLGVLVVALAGCAGKQEAGSLRFQPTPQNEQAAEQVQSKSEKADAKEEAGKMTPYDASYGENEAVWLSAVDIPADLAAGPRKGPANWRNWNSKLLGRHHPASRVYSKAAR